MPADIKSSLVQIAQNVLDEAAQAIKIIDVTPGGGGATEVTAERIADAVESINTKTPVDPATETKQDTGNASLAAIDTSANAIEASTASIDTKTPALVSGASPVISGLGIPAHDSLTYTSGMTTDTYIYYTGGLAGTQVSQVLITYTDNTKAILQSVVRS